jgi:methionyl-tRNA formyltransferase
VKIAVAASPDVAIPVLDYLLASEHDLALVISRPDSQVGRGRNSTPTAAAIWAVKNGVELFSPNQAVDFDERLKDFDLVVTIGYGMLLPEFILGQPKHGFINLHFSLLPKLRGAAPVQRAIINGLSETGVTVFKLEAGMDTGPIYWQQHYSITPNSTAGQLLGELAQLGPSAIAETLKAITNGVQPTVQNHALATIAPKLSKAEGKIDWSDSAKQIVNKILGFSPNPGATAIFRGESLRVNRAIISDATVVFGQIVFTNGSVIVGCSSGSVELLEVTPAGKKTMTAIAWANGARFAPGEIIE